VNGADGSAFPTWPGAASTGLKSYGFRGEGEALDFTHDGRIELAGRITAQHLWRPGLPQALAARCRHRPTPRRSQGQHPRPVPRRDLFEAIERGDYPEWELGLQIVEEEDEFKFDFDLLDATKLIPEELIRSGASER
jgi:hypothetical protein